MHDFMMTITQENIDMMSKYESLSHCSSMEVRIYRPYFLSENTRSQIIGVSTPDKHNTKKRYSKWSVYANWWHLPPIATSSFYHHVCESGENSQLPSLLQEGKRKMDNGDFFVAFRRVAWRIVSCLPCFRALMGMPIWIPCRGHWETSQTFQLFIAI